jgi:hypothetical protein
MYKIEMKAQEVLVMLVKIQNLGRCLALRIPILLLLTYFVQQKTALVVQEAELLMSLFGREAVGSPRLLSAIIFRIVLPV